MQSAPILPASLQGTVDAIRDAIPANIRTACSKVVEAEQDCVLIVTDHARVDYDHVVAHARLVIDTRNATASRGRSGASHARIVKA